MNNPLSRQTFSIHINAPAKVVWHKMLDKENYKYWTQEFEPTSYYVGELQQGETIHFLSQDRGGMFATIEKLEPYNVIGFVHKGVVEEGKEVSNNENSLPFVGAIEEYYFTEKNGETQLDIIVDTTPQYAEFMKHAWERALLRLKENAKSSEDIPYITPILVSTTIQAPIEKVWNCFTQPPHIDKWSHASDDWACKNSMVDLRIGGTFSSYLYAIDGSAGFEFSGVYTDIISHMLLKYTLGDGRKVIVNFGDNGSFVTIRQYFEPENENTREQQQEGWQAFLNNFKVYVESL